MWDMRLISVLLMWCCLVPVRVPGAEARFRSGERVRGEVVALGAEGLRIRPRWSLEPVTTELAEIEQVLLPPAAGFPLRAGGSDVRFRTGDRVEGDWLEMSDDVLILKTSWGQRVRVRREAVREIRFSNDSDRVLMRGPSHGSEWHFRDPMGTGGAGAETGNPFIFHAVSGMSARTALPKLPIRFVFEVDVRPSEPNFLYRLNLFGLGDNTRGPGNVNLEVNHRMLAVSGEGRDLAETVTWRDRLPEVAAAEQRFVFWVDLESETVEVDLNDERMLTLKLPEASTLIGAEDRMFSFQAQGGDGQIELLGLRLREHRSTLAPRRSGFTRSDLDRIYLWDGRRVEGRLLSFGSETLRVLEGRDVLVLSRDRVAAVVFADSPADVKPGSDLSVRVRTLDYRGRLTLRPVNGDGDSVRGGVSGWLDEAVIPFSNLVRMETVSSGKPERFRGRDEMHLLNGDLIFGEVSGLDGTTLQFLRGERSDPLRIPAAYVGHIRRSGGAEAVERDADTRLDYVNGDRLSGRFVWMDEAEVVLKTAWGQTVRSRREFIRRMVSVPSGRALLWRGPGRLEDWHVQVSGPVVTEESQVGSSVVIPGIRGIVRSMPPMPDRFEIRIHMRAEGGPGDFTVELFAMGSVDVPLGGLHFFSQGPRLHGAGTFAGFQNTVYFRKNLGTALDSGRRDLRVLADLRREEMMLVFNGEVIGPWRIQHPSEMRMQPERLMRITSRSPFQRLWVEDIVFAAHPHAFSGEGVLEIEGGAGDRVLFSNGDVLVTSVSDGEGEALNLQIEGETLRVPRSRIQSIDFHQDSVRFPRRTARDTRVWHAGTRDRLTVSLSEYDGAVFRGRGDPWLEDLHLPQSSFRVAEFNVHTSIRFDERIEGNSK